MITDGEIVWMLLRRLGGSVSFTEAELADHPRSPRFERERIYTAESANDVGLVVYAEDAVAAVPHVVVEGEVTSVDVANAIGRKP